MSCTNTSPSGIYSLPCSHFQASHSLFLPQKKLCHPQPAWPMQEFKNKQGSSTPGWEEPLCSHQSPNSCFSAASPSTAMPRSCWKLCVHIHSFEEMRMSGRARSPSPLLNFHCVLANQILQLSLDKCMFTRLDTEQRG